APIAMKLLLSPADGFRNKRRLLTKPLRATPSRRTAAAACPKQIRPRSARERFSELEHPSLPRTRLFSICRNRFPTARAKAAPPVLGKAARFPGPTCLPPELPCQTDARRSLSPGVRSEKNQNTSTTWRVDARLANER